jgi:hypothetical protein
VIHIHTYLKIQYTMPSFHAILLAILATSPVFLHIVSAATDITCNGAFPKAADGFAQRPDGCSGPNDPSKIRDKWGSANFGGHCDNHDRCYYTLGSNVNHCNAEFCGGLRDACKKAYCAKVPIVGRVCEPVTYGSCLAIAETYCQAVKAAVGDPWKYYHKAQELQKSYETCIETNGGIAPPVLCANGKPEGAMWSEIRDGDSCTRDCYICKDGQIVLEPWKSVTKPDCINEG